MNWVNIGSGNGLSPFPLQANTWSNVGLLLIGPLENFQWNFIRKSNIFIKENAIDNLVCQTDGHFFQGRWVKLISILCTLIIQHYNAPTTPTSADDTASHMT